MAPNKLSSLRTSQEALQLAASLYHNQATSTSRYFFICAALNDLVATLMWRIAQGCTDGPGPPSILRTNGPYPVNPPVFVITTKYIPGGAGSWISWNRTQFPESDWICCMASRIKLASCKSESTKLSDTNMRSWKSRQTVIVGQTVINGSLRPAYVDGLSADDKSRGFFPQKDYSCGKKGHIWRHCPHLQHLQDYIQSSASKTSAFLQTHGERPAKIWMT